MTHKKVTAAEVARRCGVSKPTVSAILGSSPRITSRYGAATRNKVEAMAKELGYRPNRAARMMRHGRHGAIGLLVHKIEFLDQAVFGELLRAAHRRDQVLMLDQSPENEEDAATILEEDMIDGLIVFMNMPDSMMNRVNDFAGPVLHLNTNKRTGGDAITPDDEGGVRLALERFAATGRKNVAILRPRTSLSGHYSLGVRRDEFHSGCQELGLRVAWDLAVDYGQGGCEVDNVVSLIVDRFRAQPDTDGVLVIHNTLIPWLCIAVCGSGLPLSDDLAVITFDHTMFGAVCPPRITSLRIAPDQAAESIMTRMDALIAGKQTGNPVRLPYSLMKY